ncbi:serine hydrolase FSH [Aspergillus californicus]
MSNEYEILQGQTGAIRYELGNRHTYDFVEGTVPWKLPSTSKDSMMDDEETFAYFDPTRAESLSQAVEHLGNYVEAEGPYDGVIGFSMGALVAIWWMMQCQSEGKPLPFRVAILFSASPDAKSMPVGNIPDVCLDLPTAHIWGEEDAWLETAQIVSRICTAEKRSIYVHQKGHEISGAPEDVIGMVKAINRALAMAA